MDRFDFCNYPEGSYMHKCDDGEYCAYDDYEVMEKRATNAELKANKMLEKIACGAFIVFFALVTVGLYFACYGGAI